MNTAQNYLALPKEFRTVEENSVCMSISSIISIISIINMQVSINTHTTSDQPLIQTRSKATMDVVMTIIFKYVTKKFPENICQKHKTSSYNSLANSAYMVAKVHSEEK